MNSSLSIAMYKSYVNDVLSVSGNISYFKIIDLLNKCISENESDALVMINSMLKEGKEVPRIINDIILFRQY